MTYITPDWIALEQEAKRYAARHPMPLVPAFIGNNVLDRGRCFPLLSAQPLPPYSPKVWFTHPVTGAKVPKGANTSSPLERDYVDTTTGPGAFLHGDATDLGDDAPTSSLPKILTVAILVSAGYIAITRYSAETSKGRHE